MAFRKLIQDHLGESPRFQKFAVRAVVKIEEIVAKNRIILEESLEKIVKSEKIDPKTKRFFEEITVTTREKGKDFLQKINQLKRVMAKQMKGAHGTSKWL